MVVALSPRESRTPRLSQPSRRAPVQIWATWFPRDGQPETFIQEFPLEALRVSGRRSPFFLEAGPNRIEDASCRGALEVRGHRLSGICITVPIRHHAEQQRLDWFFRAHLIPTQFSRGEIRLDDQVFRGDPLGFGVQGHNCGFRHRHFWTWTHACFPQSDGRLSTFEALVYEMPFDWCFRTAILWHEGRAYVFRKLRESAAIPSDALDFSNDLQGGSIEVESRARPVLAPHALRQDRLLRHFRSGQNSLARAGSSCAWEIQHKTQPQKKSS